MRLNTGHPRPVGRWSEPSRAVVRASLVAETAAVMFVTAVVRLETSGPADPGAYVVPGLFFFIASS